MVLNVCYSVNRVSSDHTDTKNTENIRRNVLLCKDESKEKDYTGSQDIHL